MFQRVNYKNFQILVELEQSDVSHWNAQNNAGLAAKGELFKLR
jgi:hypothetical protein